MKQIATLLLRFAVLMLTFAAPTGHAAAATTADIAGVVKAGTPIDVIGEGFAGTEGPLAWPDGSLLFTENRAGRISRVALDGKDKPNNVEMARVLIDAGAELNESLVAAASINNRAVAELLLDRGAAIDGIGGW